MCFKPYKNIVVNQVPLNDDEIIKYTSIKSTDLWQHASYIISDAAYKSNIVFMDKYLQLTHIHNNHMHYTFTQTFRHLQNSQSGVPVA